VRTIGLIDQRLREGHNSFCNGAHVHVPPSGCTERLSNRRKPKVRRGSAGTRRPMLRVVILPRRRRKLNRYLEC
jgi:hypothetical protein